MPSILSVFLLFIHLWMRFHSSDIDGKKIKLSERQASDLFYESIPLNQSLKWHFKWGKKYGQETEVVLHGGCKMKSIEQKSNTLVNLTSGSRSHKEVIWQMSKDSCLWLIAKRWKKVTCDWFLTVLKVVVKQANLQKHKPMRMKQPFYYADCICRALLINHWCLTTLWAM